MTHEPIGAIVKRVESETGTSIQQGIEKTTRIGIAHNGVVRKAGKVVECAVGVGDDRRLRTPGTTAESGE